MSDCDVLILDDDPLVTRSLTRGLSRRGVAVQTSNRSIGFLALVRRHRPSLLVMDITMPGLDGTQVTRLVRAEPDLSQVQIILYAGVSDADLAERAAACDADGWVPKDADPEQTLDTFARWSKRRRRPDAVSRPRIAGVRRAS